MLRAVISWNSNLFIVYTQIKKKKKDSHHVQFHSLFQLVYPAHPHLISIQSDQEMNIKFSLLAWHGRDNI